MRRSGCVNSGAIHGRRPDRRRAATSRPHLPSTRTRNSFASGGRMARVLGTRILFTMTAAAFALAGCGPTPAALTGASLSPRSRSAGRMRGSRRHPRGPGTHPHVGRLRPGGHPRG